MPSKASDSRAKRPAQAQQRDSDVALAVISGAQLMIVLDSTIVNVALPSIQRHLAFSSGNLVWVATAYALTFGGLLLLGGRSGDLFGRRRMFMVGITIFAAASLLGGFAQNGTWLILTRGLQGIGGAIASPTALALITSTFAEGAPRNRALGVYAAMSGGGSAAGLLLGGVLTDLVSWRWVFFVNVPIAALVLFAAPRVLGESERGSGRLDLAGAATATSGMIALVYGLTNAATHGWGVPGTVGPLVGALVLLAAFVVLESRVPEPMMPLSIFGNRNRTASFALVALIAASMFAMLYFLTLFLQGVLGYSPLRAGLAFLPTSVVIVVASAVISRSVGRIGVRIPLILGPALAAGAFAWLTRLTPTSGYAAVLFPLLILALGLGLSFVPLTLTAVAGVRKQDAGLAASLLNTSQQVGGALGLAVLSTIATTASRQRLTELLQSHGGQISPQLAKAATTDGYTQAFTIAAALAALAFVISVLVIRGPRRGPSDEAAVPAMAWGCGGPAGGSTVHALKADAARALLRMRPAQHELK